MLQVRDSISHFSGSGTIAPVSQVSAATQKLIDDGAARLLARASDGRSLDVAALAPRVFAALNKYLLSAETDASPQTISEFIDGLHADDLCLIVACERSDERAWSDLVEQFGATVRSAARSASSNEDAAEDLAQSIWAELHGLRVRDDGRPSGKISYYSGRGSLGGWLRAVVGQLAIDQHRKSSRLVQTEVDSDFDRLAREAREVEDSFASTSAAADPENALADRRAAADIEMALAGALRKLAPEDRLLVKLYYFDGMRLKEAGAVLGVHEATASRRLSRIHVEVRRQVEEILMREHGWTQSETRRALSDAALNLDSDLEMMLTSDNKSNENQIARKE
jgi:RNA polymerase sigma-70 factor, ECF subfamily